MFLFEYPFVIITILIICCLIAGAIGLFFAIKCSKTANESEEKGFYGVKRLEKEYRRICMGRKTGALVYFGISLDSVKKLHSESKANRIFEEIKTAFMKCFAIEDSTFISEYGSEGFIAVIEKSEEEVKDNIEKCMSEANSILIDYEAVSHADVHFGYYRITSIDIPFTVAINRAKQAFTMARDKNVTSHDWSSTGGKKLEQKIKIENNIFNEIENNRFFLEYQPIIEAETMKPIGAEVLSRLNSLTDGVISPATFLTAVDSVGINDKFDYYIFKKNCSWIANDKQQRQKYFYTINFSRSTLCNPSFADTISDIVEKYGLEYSSLAVEVLEDKNLSSAEKNIMISNLKTLGDKGMSVLLDDFGSGYASFADLGEIHVSTVKIDKSITQNSVTETGFLILKNIIRTARDLGYKTLCEGIETAEQEKAVLEAGCDMLQGFYYSKPVPVTRLEQIFLKQF